MRAGHPLRIGFDGIPMSVARTGVGRYVAELLATTARLAKDKLEFTGVVFRSEHGWRDNGDLEASGVRLRKLPIALEKGFNVGTRAGLPIPFQTILPAQDIYLFTAYRSYPALGKPKISIIYDLSYLATPECVDTRYLQLDRIVPRAIMQSDAVVTISHTVANEISDAFPEAADRLIVIEPGPALTLSAEAPADWKESLSRLGLKPGYVLHVGTLEPRKNLVRLSEAWKQLPHSTALRHPLVLVGGKGWKDAAIIEAIRSAPDRVRRLSFVSDTDLRCLYEGAALAVFPTLYEGFGLPILEAMRSGTPVACSDIPVLREVGADAPAYFVNRRPEAIAEAVVNLLERPDHLATMAAKGRARATRYSWERSAGRFIQLLERFRP